jgi:hypothetical protein
MTPPQAHTTRDVWPWVGILAINRVGLLGTQGAGITGRHGMGTNTPKAAAVAAATMGLAKDMHIPKGGMLAMGFCSIILAAGFLHTITRATGSTTWDAGATPKEHFIMVPKHPTGHAIFSSPFL